MNENFPLAEPKKSVKSFSQIADEIQKQVKACDEAASYLHSEVCSEMKWKTNSPEEIARFKAAKNKADIACGALSRSRQQLRQMGPKINLDLRKWGDESGCAQEVTAGRSRLDLLARETGSNYVGKLVDCVSE